MNKSFFSMAPEIASVLLLSLFWCGLHANEGEGLTLVWSDEFNYSGSPDSTKWQYDVGGGGWGNSELQYYTGERLENARVEDGSLIIEARRESFGGLDYTSARLVSTGEGSWKYGRFEIRAKLPAGRGTWPAIWMLPTDWAYGGWPNSGEIDIMEHVGFDMNVVHGTIHTGDFNHTKGTQIGSSVLAENVDTDFHVYALEWIEDRIDIFLDGERYFTVSDDGSGTGAWPFDQQFHLLLNIAVGGSWGGIEGVDTSIFPQRMEVDYVRVYSISGRSETAAEMVPGKIESENFSDQFGVQIEPTADTGGGSNIGYLGDGDWVEYTLDVAIGGRYAIDLRYASLNGTATIELSAGAGEIASSGNLPSTGGWQNWQTREIGELELSVVTYELRTTISTSGTDDLNLNWMDLELIEELPLLNPERDSDGDGISNLMEQALVLDFQSIDSVEHLPRSSIALVDGDFYLQLEFRRREGGMGSTVGGYAAEGIFYRPEVSDNLESLSWKYGDVFFTAIGDPSSNGDGTETVAVRCQESISEGSRFVRLKVSDSN